MFPAAISQASWKTRTWYFAAMTICLTIWMLPLAAIAVTSLRTAEDLNRGNFWGWPTGLDPLRNYADVFEQTPMLSFLFNSLLIAVLSVAGTVMLSSMAGYALAKYRFRGNALLLATFIAGNLVPFQSLMIPVRTLIIHVFGIYDTRLALIVFHTAFQTGFATLFMRNFISRIPNSLIEAARLDGASELGIFWRVALPSIRPAIAGLSVLIFTFVWNDYFWSLVLVQSDSVRPVTAGLQSLHAMWLTSWQLISAGSIIAAIPPVTLFFLMQRHFVSGLTQGLARA